MYKLYTQVVRSVGYEEGEDKMFLKIIQISNVGQSMVMCKFEMFEKMLQYFQDHKSFLLHEMPCSLRF